MIMQVILTGVKEICDNLKVLIIETWLLKLIPNLLSPAT